MKFHKVDLRLVVIHWVDSGRAPGWNSISDIGHDPIMCCTVGWVVGENSHGITIAGTFGFKADGSLGQTCDTMTIPKGAIRRTKTLQFPSGM